MEKIKEWFEANYLDGDKVQNGQFLSSKECLEAITQAEKNGMEKAAKIAESNKCICTVECDGSEHDLNIAQAIRQAKEKV